jgi:glyoxylate/hydroxypyruvate reductase A
MSGPARDLLLAITAWQVPPWLDRFRRLMRDREVFALCDQVDPRRIGYVACWKHPPGSLQPFAHARVLFSLGAGVDHLMGDAALPAAPIVRVVDPDLMMRMSEYVVLHCLAILRQLDRYRRQQADGVWEDDRTQPAAREVRVGVMGLGVLGVDAATKLRIMGFDVAGWSRSEKRIDGVPTFAGPDELEPFLSRTDILVCLLPLTPNTRGILNARLFARLSNGGRLGGPWLINAGRGGLQVEADILKALDRGHLAGAVLDVFETEPLPADSPLWQRRGVVVTPHNSAMSEPDAVATYVVGQIARLEAGLPLQNVVDRNAGY